MNFLKIYNIKIAAIVALMLSFHSCDDYLDVNDDPDVILDNPGVFLLPSIQISLSSAIGGRLALDASLWCQYYNQNNTANQYRDIIDMLIKADDGDIVWDELYTSALSDIQKLKEYSNDPITYDPRLNLIASVLESYTFQIIFDAYGQAPYREAFTGESEDNFNPNFDNGAEIYPLLVDSINSAIEKYETFILENEGAIEDLRNDQQDKDYLFEGDISQWISFANSIKLKLAVRNLDYDQNWSTGVINNLESAPNYITNDVLLDIFEDERNKENPLYAQDQNLNTTINLVANRTLSEFWTTNADPREMLTYEANTADNLLLDHGDHKATTATNPPNSNRVPILDPERPVYFLTTSEVAFFRSELAVIGIISDDAKPLYDQAVMDAFERVGSTAEAADTGFLANGKIYEFSSTPADQLMDIGVQKWAALANVNPFEAFLEVHRMDHPAIEKSTEYAEDLPKGNVGVKLYLPKNTVLGTDYVKRYMLPESEALSNANFPSEQTEVTDKLWWDTK